MAEAYTNEQAYTTYRQAQQAVSDGKELLKTLRKEGEKAAEQAKRATIGTLDDKLAAIRVAWQPFKDRIAQTEEEIRKNYAIADENFDIWKGLR